MEGYDYISPSQCVCKKTDDPYIYLRVGNEWFCYDPNLEELGGGAMGNVFLGYRISNGAKIAVKRVKDYYANQPQIRERARQEASLSFRHPNLIEILGFCQWDVDNGPLFILSNYVPGVGIKEYIRSMSPEERTAENITRKMLPMLDALEYVHSRGVVHRDIKPSNIMVEDNGNVRLMDLGIARMNGGNKFSSFGFIGTPQYAAPEQILRGEYASGGIVGKEINSSTDVYASGITIYELITGTNPYDVPVDDEVLARQIKVELPVSLMIPKPIMKVLSKATKKNQSDRYQSVAEFKHALEEALEPKSHPAAWVEWMKENLGIVIGAVVGILVVVLGLIFLT